MNLIYKMWNYVYLIFGNLACHIPFLSLYARLKGVFYIYLIVYFSLIFRNLKWNVYMTLKEYHQKSQLPQGEGGAESCPQAHLNVPGFDVNIII